MRVGYVRTSKKDQNPDLQRRELEEFGCEKIFEEQISSRKADRPELRAALEYCREGDELVVWKLDRFGRSLRELIELVNGVRERGIEFVSLRESIDTTTPGGKLVFHVFGAVAEFERDIIRERTMAGLEAARARGRKGGRKPIWTRRSSRWPARCSRTGRYPSGRCARRSGCRGPRSTATSSPTDRRGSRRKIGSRALLLCNVRLTLQKFRLGTVTPSSGP